MATKDKRFQLFLFGLHDKTAEQADKNGVTLSTEVRNRVSRSYWQDEVIERLFQSHPDEQTIEDLKEFARRMKANHDRDMVNRDNEYQQWKAKQ